MTREECILNNFEYDEKTGDLYRWVGGIKRKTGTPVRRDVDSYLAVTVMNKTYLAHRVAFFLKTGNWPMADVDHINGIRSDNRWENLRAATRAENLWNRKPSHNKAGQKGVTIHRNANRRKRYGANITTRYKTTFIGWFETPEEAGAAYAAAAAVQHGEYARHGAPVNQ